MAGVALNLAQPLLARLAAPALFALRLSDALLERAAESDARRVVLAAEAFFVDVVPRKREAIGDGLALLSAAVPPCKHCADPVSPKSKHSVARRLHRVRTEIDARKALWRRRCAEQKLGDVERHILVVAAVHKQLGNARSTPATAVQARDAALGGQTRPLKRLTAARRARERTDTVTLTLSFAKQQARRRPNDGTSKTESDKHDGYS